MKPIFFVFTLLMCTINCFSQLLDNNITIYPLKSNKLYSGRSNLLGVEYKVDSFKNILVTSSEGEVKSIDKYLHSVDLKNEGSVQISVYDITNDKPRLLARLLFMVAPFKLSETEEAINRLSDKCNLSIEDFSEIEIPLSILKKATRFKVKAPYTIKSLTVYTGTGNVLTGSLNSGEFDQALTSAWKKIIPGTVITLGNVVVTDSQKKTYQVNSKRFIVTNN